MTSNLLDRSPEPKHLAVFAIHTGQDALELVHTPRLWHPDYAFFSDGDVQATSSVQSGNNTSSYYSSPSAQYQIEESTEGSTITIVALTGPEPAALSYSVTELRTVTGDDGAGAWSFEVETAESTFKVMVLHELEQNVVTTAYVVTTSAPPAAA